MRHTHILTALAIVAVTGITSHSTGLVAAWQGSAGTLLSETTANAAGRAEHQSLIYKVGTDVYSGMSAPSVMPQTMPSPQGTAPATQPRSTGDYKFNSPSSDGRYGTAPSNPSDSFLKKESSGSSSGPYGSSVYGGLPSTPSADPMIKDLSR